MATIDERVVAMAFENQVFERRAAQTIATLGKLDTSLKNMHGAKGLEDIEKSASKVTLKGPMAALDKLKTKLGRSGDGASQGLGEIERAGNKVTLDGPNKAIDKTQQHLGRLGAGTAFADIEKASDQVDLSGITKAIDNVSSKFSVLKTAASVALGGIAAQAAEKGGSFVKSFAFGPIQDGMQEYSTNLGSIQTILANTQGQQVTGLGNVNKYLGELNKYSDQTIYNFGEMAKNIGTFTAAGVKLPEATQSIKGISNLAAVSGSNSTQAATAMQQLSQAIASGKVGLEDWNSVVAAQMGGAVFQKSLARTADKLGTLGDRTVDLDKASGQLKIGGESFRESLMSGMGKPPPWLTSDVLTKTLEQFTGDMSDADLAAQGFNAEQIKAIQLQAKTAQDAATQVKTLPQVFDIARETIGSGWAQTFQLIFGDFEQAKKTFTAMSNFINGFINRTSTARNNLLKGWNDLGGRDQLLKGFTTLAKSAGTILKPIKEAFRDIFPPTTAKQLLEMTKSFVNFAKSLAIDPSTADSIKRTFAGIFAVFHIAKELIKAVVGVFLDLLGVVSKGSGGFLGFTAGIGDFLVSLDKAITSGDLFKKFFDALGGIISKPLVLIGKLASAIASLFAPSGGGKNQSQFADEIDRFGKALSPAERLVNRLKDAWDQLVASFEQAKRVLEPWLTSFMDKLKNLGDTIGNALKNINFDDAMSGVQTGLFAAIVVMLKSAFGKGGEVLEGITDTLGGVQEVLGGVTGNLEAMQKKIQAQTILAIAGAVLALAAGIFILSTIDGDKLAKAMTATAVGLGELMGAMKLMQAGLGKFGALQLPIIAAGLIGLSVAIVIMAGALKIFGTMSWEEIGKGMTALAGSLGVIAGAMRLMPDGPQMVVQAAALLVLGVALNAIGTAIKLMGSMKLETLGKGLFAIMEALAVLALTMGMMPPNMLVNAAALVVLSFALISLSGAVKAMGSMDFATIVKGLLTMTAAIAGIGIAMLFIPPTMAASAVGLFIVASALVIVGKAVKIMGDLGIATIVKGLITMAAALGIMAVGMYLMIGTLPGALAMMAAAAALAVLAPVLATLGNLEWSTIFKGLAAIALVLTTIGVVGLIAAPALAALGIALIPLGLGFLLVATAAKIFASAMSTLSETGQKGIAAFLVAITGFVALLPTIVISFIKGLVGIIDEITKIAPRVIEALGKILTMVIQFIIDNTAKLALAIGLLVDGLVTVLIQNVPKLVNAGIALLNGLLNGISSNIGMITTKVSDIIIKFMDALRNKTPDLVTAGARLLRALLDGVGSKFGEIANSVGTLIAKFATAVGNQASKITTAAATMMGKFIGAMATFGPRLLEKGAEVILKFLEGIGNKGPELIKKGVAVAGKLMKGLGDGLVGMADLAFDSVINFLNGFEAVIREKDDDLINAGLGVADAILDGVVEGFGKGGRAVRAALEQVFKLLPGWAKKVLKIKSPSVVFKEIGHYAMMGFVDGIDESKPAMKKNIEGVGKSSAEGLAKGLVDNKKVLANAALDSGRTMVLSLRSYLGIHSPSEVFREIGMNVNHGFRDGLLGSRDDVLSAFDSLNSSLIDKIRDLRTQVSDGNGRLEDLQQQHADKLAEITKLRAEKKPDNSAIADAIKEAEDLEKQIHAETVAVNQNGRALTASRNLRASLTGSMHDEKMALLGLKKDYDDVNKKIEEATATLEKITSEQKRYIDQFNVKPDVDNLVSDALADASLTDQERRDKQRKDEEEAEKRSRINQVELYKKALQEQILATAKYQVTLQKLRDLGLDDATFNKLLEKGLSGQEFAEQLLASGKSGIDQINSLDQDLLAKSTALADAAIKELYDTGVATAQGILDGLKSKKVELEKQMTDLADVMVNAIKNKLKIKSPSRIFAEVGQFTIQGLVQGLQDTRAVEGAVDSLGRTMTDALTSVIGDHVDMSPVITPVLDITQLQKDVAQVGDMSNVIPITAATSFGQASATSEEVSATQQATADAATPATPTLMFEQNNYSPEALNDVEIYRKTRNQIGQLKSALGVPA